MENIINSLFNLSLNDRIYIVEQLLQKNHCQELGKELFELEIMEIINKSQPFLEGGRPIANKVYKSKF